MTERGYEKIFCSNMMKTNQDIIRDGLKKSMVDIFMENSEYLLWGELMLINLHLINNHHLIRTVQKYFQVQHNQMWSGLTNCKRNQPEELRQLTRVPLLSAQSYCVVWMDFLTSTKLTGCSVSSGSRMRNWAALGKTVSV